jgi:hypothetical protein
MRAELRRIGIASWAVFGVGMLLAEPAIRLAATALARFRLGLAPSEWLGFVVVAVGIGYVEGYRGFSCSFCPRVVERAFTLARAPRPLKVALAPLYVMSLFGDEPARVARSWALVVAVVAMILGVRSLPHTWRCVVDASVSLSLAWGVMLLASAWLARVRRELGASWEVASPRLPSVPPPR